LLQHQPRRVGLALRQEIGHVAAQIDETRDGGAHQQNGQQRRQNRARPPDTDRPVHGAGAIVIV
jgi:hypothetical protein